MKAVNKLSVLFVGLLMLLAVFSQAFALTSPIMAPGMVVARSSGSSWLSTNWSGYAVTGSSGSVTSAYGSWKVPAVSSGASGTTTYYSAFWVGIDGFSSSTVEQVGTMAQIIGTTVSYYAWFEFYPSPMYQITSLSIKPGNTISASVTYTGSSSGSGRGFVSRQSISTFTATITDVTTGKSYTTTGTVDNAARSSAECIAEAPSSSRGLLPLANFGTVNYGLDNTAVTGTCYATVSGVNGPLGSFGSAVQRITMVTSKGVTKALPSLAPSSDGTSFSITWANAGP
ncbi:MAG: G1 family glutamic endopeptidase [Candidatus Bathyarchaeia archaeon]